MSHVMHKRLSVLILVLLLSGCDLFSGEKGPTETASPPSVTSTVAPRPPFGFGLPAPTVTKAPSTATPEPDVTKLVMWTTEEYAPNNETPGGTVLLEQIQAFQQANPSVTVEVILKKKSGPGGLLDFLTTASAAAPSALPDVITLSLADMHKANQANLLYPLDDLISPELLADRFDFATSLTRIDDKTMGILYRADLQHLVYDTTLVEAAPTSWFNIYHSGTPFVFSPEALKDGANDVILIQYLGAQGTLTDEQGQVALDPLALARALRFLEQAHEEGAVSAAILILKEDHNAWSEFRNGNTGIVQVPASLYLADRGQFPRAQFAPVPIRPPDSSSEPGPPTVGHGWALCVTTADPQRQSLAAELIEHLLAPENSGHWTQTVGYLPTRRAALEAWDPTDPYVPFIRDLLERAAPTPPPDVAGIIGPPLTSALREVLTGSATAREAADKAVLAVQSGR